MMTIFQAFITGIICGIGSVYLHKFLFGEKKSIRS